MPSRWDFLLDQKPVPLAEYLLDEVAKLLVKDLSQWPPPVRELEPSLAAGLHGVLESRRPPDALFEEAFRLARLDLERQLEAYDDYVRNRRWLERGLAPEHKPALLFLTRFLIEQMLSLGEATEGRVHRKAMLSCLERAERRWSAERKRLLQVS